MLRALIAITLLALHAGGAVSTHRHQHRVERCEAIGIAYVRCLWKAH